MLMELIEKKDKPIKTKVQFTKKEWENSTNALQRAFEIIGERHETKRLIYFICDGNLIKEFNKK